KYSTVGAGAEAVGGPANGSGAFGQVSELVSFEVSEGRWKVALDSGALERGELGADAFEQPPAEARVTDLVRPDARQEGAQRAFWHFEPFCADQRHGDGLTH